MAPLLSALLTVLFLLLGLGAVTVMLLRLGRPDVPPTPRLLLLHRVFGWGFTAIFLVMLATMFDRFYAYWEEDPARIVAHYSAAFALMLILLLKVSIPRFFPGFRKHLFFLGTSLYLVAFLVAASALSHYLVRMTQNQPYISHAVLSAAPDLELGKQLTIDRCRTCHVLDSVLRTRTAIEWEKVVGSMAKLAWPRIRPDEAKQILHYLVTTRVPKTGTATTGFPDLDLHCLSCHEPDEIFLKKRTRKEWEELTRRMSDSAPLLVPLAQTDRIVEALVEAQRKMEALR